MDVAIKNLNPWKPMNKDRSFFSVGLDLVTTGVPMAYDLYVNSSALVEREKFVKIFPRGDILESSDLRHFKYKYHQLYVLESQRGDYLKSLVQNDNLEDREKTKVIKDSAIVYLNKVFDKSKEFNTELLKETIEGCRDSVESMIEVIRDYDITQVQKLIGDLSYHDFYTYDHSINVAMYTIAIFKELRPRAKRKEMITAGLGGLLHDLGKIRIPTSIINNPGKLSDLEFAEIKKHPDHGVELMDEREDMEVEDVDLHAIKRVIHEHHENYNGTGYPQGLAEKEIHLVARIVAIADFFDALTTKRSYHEVLKTEDALEVMAKSVGKKIDPQIFDVFCQNVSDLVLKGKTNRVLPDDFDACRPHNVLPFEVPKATKKAADIFKDKPKEDYGKIKESFRPSKDERKKAS